MECSYGIGVEMVNVLKGETASLSALVKDNYYNIHYYEFNSRGNKKLVWTRSMRYLGRRDSGWDAFFDEVDIDVVALYEGVCSDESSDYPQHWTRYEIDNEHTILRYEITFDNATKMAQLTVFHNILAKSVSTDISFSSYIDNLSRELLYATR